jgi:peptidoglycan-associated lipoprotein
VIAAVALSITVFGCAKKRPAAAPPVPTSYEADAPAPTQPAVEQEPGAAAHDPLGGDLESVNRYVWERGLLADVYYDYDEARLLDEARATLRRNSEFMKAQPQFVFELQGHCDERGTIGYNLALGQRRAAAARDYLAALDIPQERMRIVSYGRERPDCIESNERCWSRNRRTHFVIIDRR